MLRTTREWSKRHWVCSLILWWTPHKPRSPQILRYLFTFINFTVPLRRPRRWVPSLCTGNSTAHSRQRLEPRLVPRGHLFYLGRSKCKKALAHVLTLFFSVEKFHSRISVTPARSWAWGSTTETCSTFLTFWTTPRSTSTWPSMISKPGSFL